MKRYRAWLVGVVLVGGLLAVALWPQAVAIDVGDVTRAALQVTIDEEGETRVRRRFIVSSPVTARVLRIDLEPGDPVVGGATVVAQLQPETPALLDARSRAEAEAIVEAARAVLGRTRAELARAGAELARLERELARERELDASGLTTGQAIDLRAAEVAAARETLRAAEYASASAASDLARAEARLRPTGTERGRVLAVTAPVDGVVLRRLRESEGVVPAGEPLVEIGDPADLEIIADLLSTDAVRVQPGAAVLIDQWGGDTVLRARVRRIEPAGFTKISALGVEEQRVYVVMDFEDPAEAWARLGDGYRVEVRIVVHDAADVVSVPISALFRRGDAWAVFVVEAGRARVTTVTLGARNQRQAEVTGGLSPGTQVVLHPGDTLTDGARVALRGAT
ncbi:MAG: efflux RND transporter periplasmic adaptor subunit [Vicinamibacterales bacterium]|nr:efflux RND transporter periplasmic adaptor subunit [Vicinamibacterales bacterium]